MATTQNTTARPTSLEGWLQALAGAMTYTRRSDGTAYWHLSDAAYWQPIREDLQSVCRDAHRYEMPNDWRWQLIGDIVNRLLEYSEPEPDSWDADRFREISWDVADSLASYSTVELADWVSDHAARGEFENPGLVEGLSPSISTLLRWRQIEEVQLMIEALVSALDDLMPG